MANDFKNQFVPLSELAIGTPYSAEYLSLLARKGKLPARKIDNVWHATREAVSAYVGEQKNKAFAKETQTEWKPLAELAPLTPYSAEYLSLLARRHKLPARKIDNVWYATKADIAAYQAKVSPVAAAPLVLPAPERKLFLHDVRRKGEEIALKLAEVKGATKRTFTTYAELLSTLPAAKVRRWTPGKALASGALALTLALSAGAVSLSYTAPQLASRANSQAAQALASLLPAEMGATQAASLGSLFSSLRDVVIAKFFGPRDESGEEASPNLFASKVEIDATTLAEAVSKALTEAAPAYNPAKYANTSLTSEIRSFIQAEISRLSAPNIAYNTYSPVILREEILLADTRPTVTRQSTADIDHGSSALSALANGGSLFDNKLTRPTIVDGQGNFTSLQAGNVTATNATTTNLFAENATFDSLSSGSLSLSDFTFTNATGTNATTTNLFAENAVGTNLDFSGILFTNATGTSATTTNFFTTTGSTTNLFFTAANGGTQTLSGTLSAANLFASGSSTLQNFTFVNATGTSATTTNFYSSRGVFGGPLSFTGTDHLGLQLNSLTTAERDLITPALGALIYNTTVSKFQAYSGSWKNIGNPEIGSEVTSGTGGSVLFIDGSGNLAQDNANFNWDDSLDRLTAANLSFGNATGTNATTTNAYFSNSLTGPGSFTVDASGNVGIGTTNPGAALDLGAVGGYANTWSNSTGYLFNTRTYSRAFYDADNSTYFLDPNSSTSAVLAGNLGIATTSPFEKFSVSGNAYIGGNLTATGTLSVLNGLTSLSNLLLSGSSTLQDFTALNSTTTNATTTNFFSTNLKGTNIDFTNLTFDQATGTAATTTNLYSSIASFGEARTANDLYVGGSLTVAGSLTSSITNGQIQFLAIPQGTAISQGTVYINPASAGTNNVLLGLAVNGTEKARIDAEGDIQIIGTFNSTNTTGTNSLSGGLSVLGNVTLGDASSDTLTITSQISSNLVPSADNTYSLGTDTNKWSEFHATTAFFDQVAVSSSTLSAFIINSDNATSDTEDATLEFARGLSTPNAIIKWNSSSDRFEFNDFPVYLTNALTVAGTGDSSVAGLLTLSGTPSGTGLGQGSFYINPSSASTDRTLVGIGVNGVERFRVDAEGDTTIQGSLGIENSLYDISQDTLTINDDLQVNGNDIKDSGGTARLSLGSTNTVTGALTTTGALTGASLDVGSGAITSGLVNGQTISSSASFTGTLSVTAGLTTLSNLLATGSSTLQNFTFVNATGTSATTTNLFSTIASSTNLFSSLAAIGGAQGLNVIAGGNVGIGTTNPGEKLSVNGNAMVSIYKDYDNTNYYLDPTGVAGISAALNGSVGIGSTNPGGKLDIVTAVGGAGTHTLRVSDDSTGSYFGNVSNTKFSLLTNNTRALTIDTSQNVGIGTTTPQAVFHTVGQIRASVADDTTAFRITEADGVTNAISFYRDTNNAFTLDVGSASRAFVVNISGNVGIGSSTPFAKLSVKGAGSTTGVNFQTTNSSDSPLFTILDNGKTGIGTSTPGSLLSVSGSTDATVANIRGSSNTNYALVVQNGGGSGMGVQINTGSGSTNAATILSANNGAGTNYFTVTNGNSYFQNGNVGIGTTSPSNNLTVSPATSGGIDIRPIAAPSTASVAQSLNFVHENGANLGFLRMGYDTDATDTTEYTDLSLWATQSGANIKLGTNNTERVRIDGNGNVGIGTTAPTLLGGKGLHIANAGQASLRFQDTSDTNEYFDISVSSANNEALIETAYSTLQNIRYDSYGFQSWSVQDAEKMRLTSAGNLGIGSTTPYAKLSVSGFSSGAGIVADALSGFTGNLLDLKLASTTKFSVNQAGDLLLSGSTTLQNFTFVNATGTSATTTNLFSTTASSTNLFSSLAAIGGAQGLNVIAGGNVGIGTTNPTTPLTLSSSNGTRITNWTGATTGYQYFNAANTGANLQFGIDNSTGGGLATNSLAYSSSIGTGNGTAFHVYTNAIVRATFDTSGNVGIGTTDPSYVLTVKGSSAGAQDIFAVTADDNGAVALISKDASDNGFSSVYDGSGNEDIRLHTSGNSWLMGGNVGIGTTSPNSLLSVRSGNTSSVVNTGVAQFGVSPGSSSAGVELGTYTGGYGMVQGVSFTAGTTNALAINPFGGNTILNATAGNVGIGTTNPGQTLVVRTSSASATGLNLANSNASGSSNITFNYNTSDVIGSGNLGRIWSNTSANELFIGTGQAGGSTADIVFKSSVGAAAAYDTEIARFTRGGNMGLGSTTPYAKLSVSGFSSGAGIVADALSGFTGNLLDLKLASTTKFSVDQAGNTFINGNVGIGLTNPSTKLVLGSGTFTLKNAAGDADGLKIYQDTGDAATFMNYYSGPMIFGTADTERVRITSSGLVGIGTTSPFAKLSVGAHDQSLSTPLFVVASSSSAVATTTHFIVTGAGDVGIGTTSPSAQLAVAGNLYVANSGGTATSTFIGDVHITDTLQVGTGSAYLSSDRLSFGGSTAAVLNSSGKLQLQAGGTGTGSTGTGSIYFLSTTGTTEGRVETTSEAGLLGTGTGNDGAISLSSGSSTNCQTTAIASGRTSADCIATTITNVVTAGNNSVAVTSSTGFATGDEILIIQMTGTGVGNYEFAKVGGVSGNTLNLTSSLGKSYAVTGAQVVRVPNYTNVTLTTSGTKITVSAWNGTTGGVLAFRVSGTLSMAAGTSIDVSALGSSGGATKAGGAGGQGASYAGGGACNADSTAGGASAAGNAGSSVTGTAATAGGAGGGGGAKNVGYRGGGGGGGTGGGGGGGAYATANNGSAGVSGVGGTGGYATAGGTGAAGAAGSAGTTFGEADLDTVFLGGGGAGGASGAGGGGAQCYSGAGSGPGGAGGAGGSGGAGGNGGGILFLEVATINNSGTITAAGGNGSNGSTGANGTANGGGGGGGAGGAGGGGGAGGSLFLKVSSTVTAIGTVTAAGGTAGTGGNGGNGGNGDDTYGDGGGGTGTVGGSAGGPGGAATAGASAAPGAGGAGGDGRVRCDTPSGSCSATPTANQNVYSATTLATTNGYGTLYIGSVNTNSADLAEYYVTGDRSLAAGDLVCLSNTRLLDDGGEELVSQGVLRKCAEKNDARAIGVISTSPGVTLGSIDGETGAEDQRALALSGRVPVRVSTENGEVKIGDHLTSSSIPGVAMKATGFANVIGISLGNFATSSAGTSEVVTRGAATSTVKVGTVNVFVNLGQKKLDVNVDESGKLETEAENFVYDFSGFNLSQVKSLESLSGTWAIGEDGTASTTKLCVKEACIGEAQLEILLEIADAAFATSTDASASSTATSTDAFLASALFTRIWEGIMAKLAGFGVFFSDSFVRITNLFVSSIHIENELCIDDVCINKDQLKALIIQAGATQASTTPETQPAPDSGTAAGGVTVSPENSETASSTPTTATSTPEVAGGEETATSTTEILSGETATSTPEILSGETATSTSEVTASSTPAEPVASVEEPVLQAESSAPAETSATEPAADPAPAPEAPAEG